MLSIRELEVFRRVMELGTITAAAEALRISQPAVSRTLQQAERRLGFPLFLRRKKRLLATPEAQSLFPETVSAFAAFDVVQKRAADLQAGRAGGLNIAAISAFANALLPTAVAIFRRSRPDVVITLQSMSALQVATHVANHQADLGFVIDFLPNRQRANPLLDRRNDRGPKAAIGFTPAHRALIGRYPHQNSIEGRAWPACEHRRGGPVVERNREWKRRDRRNPG